MTVSNYKAINKGALEASFDIHLESGFRIAEALLMQKEGRFWVSFPGIPFERDGKKGYKTVIEIPDRGRRDQFNEAAIAELRAAGFLQ